MGNLSDCREIAAGFLHTNNVIIFVTKSHDGLRSNVDTGTTWNIVKENRKLHCFRNIAKMYFQAFLSGFVVVRRYQKKSVCSGFFSLC